MKTLGILVLAAVQLGGGFGEASADVDELTEQSMIVDIQVQVAVSSDAVVAHLSFDDDQTITIPLLDRGGGHFGVRTELEPKNYLVIFEAVGAPGELSESVSLVELGADLDSPVVATTRVRVEGEDDEGLTPETRRLGWLALALAAASLSVLAFWALGDRDDDDEEPADDGAEVEQTT